MTRTTIGAGLIAFISCIAFGQPAAHPPAFEVASVKVADGSNATVAPNGGMMIQRRVGGDLAGPGYHINRSNLLVLESKADMQKRGQASPDDGDALALTFAQPVAPAEVEEEAEEEGFGRYTGGSNSGWIG
jgi:hypothetical protein